MGAILEIETYLNSLKNSFVHKSQNSSQRSEKRDSYMTEINKERKYQRPKSPLF